MTLMNLRILDKSYPLVINNHPGEVLDETFIPSPGAPSPHRPCAPGRWGHFVVWDDKYSIDLVNKYACGTC